MIIGKHNLYLQAIVLSILCMVRMEKEKCFVVILKDNASHDSHVNIDYYIHTALEFVVQ